MFHILSCFDMIFMSLVTHVFPHVVVVLLFFACCFAWVVLRFQCATLFVIPDAPAECLSEPGGLCCQIVMCDLTCVRAFLSCLKNDCVDCAN